MIHSQLLSQQVRAMPGTSTASWLTLFIPFSCRNVKVLRAHRALQPDGRLRVHNIEDLRDLGQQVKGKGRRP